MMAPRRAISALGIERMQIQKRILVLGILIALGASDAQAWGKKKKVEPPPPPPAPVVVVPPPPPQTIYSGDVAVAPQIITSDLMQTAPIDVQSVAQWIRASRDNGNMHYLLLDKTNATVYFFHANGNLLATAPVLLGMGKGDKMLVPDTAPLSSIPPFKRITPAGRFVSRLAVDSHGKELLVLDYDAALSLHPVVKGTPKEQRAVRLASPASDDNRISFGCINVPAAFYSGVVSPLLTNTKGVVYILPETSSAGQLFGFQDPPAAPVVPGAPVAPIAPAAPAAGQVSTSASAEAPQVAPVAGAK
jgi:hypothetical protein